jgi:uncharacterized protein
MDNIAGTPVEGDNFYGREADLLRLREGLDHHDILLLGARRIGKTSIARAIMKLVRSDGWHSVEINVAACQNEHDFLTKLETALKPLLESMPGKLIDSIGAPFAAIGKRIKSVKLSIPGAGGLDVGIGADEAEDWPIVANDLLKLIAKTSHHWLIYLDELPIFLFNIIRNDPANGVQRVRRFLDWFRNDVRAMPDVNTVRWLISGSVGLDTLVQQHGMADTINSLRHESLAAFSDPVASAMLFKLATRYQIAFSEEDAKKLIAAVLWSQPYYLQLAFNHLRSVIKAAENRGDAEDADERMTGWIEATITHMAEPGADNDFHHWEGRLRIQLSHADAAHCQTLLTLAAQTREGARPETLLDALHERLPNADADEAKRAFIVLREILERDAYWWPDASSGQKRYRFHLEPLRRWWLRRNTL